MCETKFYVCEHCGNLVGLIHDAGVPMMCCGQKMTKLEPGTVDASREKHVPVISVNGNTVRVDIGTVAHPMTEEHSILWVYLLTSKGGQRKCLPVGEAPVVYFALTDDETPIAAYAYCNLHGLWMAEPPKLCPVEKKPESKEANYVVCNCNNVTYLDIIHALDGETKLDDVLKLFEHVKNTTKCSTGCGGCYEKVVAIISDYLA